MLEYLVRELCDGVTPAPQFQIEGQIPSDGPFPDSEQIYTFEVDRLGLIDLSLSGILPPALAERPSGLGQRYVVDFWARHLLLGSQNPLFKANDVVNEGYVNLQALETIPVASTQFYSRKGYTMPQGTVLRVQDMAPNVPGRPLLLRLGIIVPPTIREDALMREALCCTQDIPTTTDSLEDCVTPNVLTPGVSPNQLTPGVSPQQITINASPVSPEFTNVVVTGPSGEVVPTNVEIIFPDKILFTAVFNIVGQYDVFISNGAGCDVNEINAFNVG